MKQFLFSLIVFTIQSVYLFGQQMIPQDIPTPQAANLGQFGNIPMSYYSGRANISIPLYTFSLRNITFPISLSYDCGGVLVNSLPGWTGHNWTLSAGGTITRVAQQRYDEYIYPAGAELSYPAYNYFSSYGALNRLLSQPSDNYKALRDSILYGTVDMAPDIFYFNFLGISGRFFLGNDGEWKVDCEQNIEVVFDYNDASNFIKPFISEFPFNMAIDEQPKTIKGFMLRDEYGNKYYFGGTTNAIDYRTEFFRMSNSEKEYSWMANSWHLTKVTDRHNNVIYELTYNRGHFIAQVVHSVSAEIVNNSAYWGFGAWSYYGCSYINYTPTFPYRIEINAPVYLSQISLADGRNVSFSFSNIPNTTQTYYRSYYDSGMPNTLQMMMPSANEGHVNFYYLQTDKPGISQYQVNPGSNDRLSDPLSATGIRILQKIILNTPKDGVYNYYLEYNMNKFPMLKAVKMVNNAINYAPSAGTIGTYTLKYNNLDRLPEDHLTRAIDHWGYYNGNAYQLPSASYPSFMNFKYQRNPNSTYAKYGLLHEIIYPTGGTTTFEYEMNDFSKCQTLDRQLVKDTVGIGGGMRIKSITEYSDSLHTTMLSRRTFSYKIPGSNYSSGQLFAPPVYFWEDWQPKDANGNHSIHISYFRTSSIVPLSNSFNPVVGYSYVRETFSDGTSNLYRYSNYSDVKDEKNLASFNDTSISPYDMFNEKGYARGKLINKKVFDSSDILKQETTYSYTGGPENTYYVLTTNLMWENVGNSGTFFHYAGCVYKLLYPKYSPLHVETTNYYSGHNLSETTTYNWSDYNMAISHGNFTHHVDFRKLGSEVTVRGNDPVVVSYVYPFFSTNDVVTQQLTTKQFYLQPVTTMKTLRGHVISKRTTEYTLFSGKTLPKDEIEYHQEVPDTLVSYLTYTNTGALSRYREIGKPVTNLTWGWADNYLLSKTEGNRLTQYSYNGLKVVKITQPNGNFNTYEYDDMGRLIKIRDRNGKLIKQFSYNFKNK